VTAHTVLNKVVILSLPYRIDGGAFLTSDTKNISGFGTQTLQLNAIEINQIKLAAPLSSD
jgi:hypothetical protein